MPICTLTLNTCVYIYIYPHVCYIDVYTYVYIHIYTQTGKLYRAKYIIFLLIFGYILKSSKNTQNVLCEFAYILISINNFIAKF
jgi:hypothetical protein